MHTIWAALRRLRADGYIDMKNGRITKVIYKQTEQERKDLILDYVSLRWPSYIDIYQAAELIYVPFLIEGFRRMNEQEIDYIDQLAKRANADDTIRFFSFTLQKNENSLLMNLFWETSLFMGYPFVKSGFRPFDYNTEIGRKRLKLLVHLVKEGSFASAREALIQHERCDIEKLIANMKHQIRIVPENEQISFAWRIYNGHPQICYHMASRLLHEIYLGEYRKTEFLPFYEKMSEKYSVSVSTARRAVSMLNQIGAVQTINGKGTRIQAYGEKRNQPDFNSLLIRRNLSYLVQSFELILCTCEEVSHHFFSHLLPEESLQF